DEENSSLAVSNFETPISEPEASAEKPGISAFASMTQNFRRIWQISGAGVLLFGIYLGGKMLISFLKP
ncbi:MAG: hypothetical protein PHQ47_02495, partial [Candidatus Portnoybacteria bacterium]|nr:hypothetical protein [Candidatus Portnoybacteria bacterium]